MGLVLGDRSMFDALGHYEYFAWADTHGAAAHLNGDMPNQNQKEVVGIIVFVPDEFAFDLHDHEVMTVEAADDSRLPMI